MQIAKEVQKVEGAARQSARGDDRRQAAKLSATRSSPSVKSVREDYSLCCQSVREGQTGNSEHPEGPRSNRDKTSRGEHGVSMSDKLANPAPLGLLAFGMTTVLLNLHNAGFYPLDSMILAMGFAYGGIAQIIVGSMEFRKGNTFGTVAFTSYGLFWWSLVVLLLLPKGSLGVEAPSATALAAYFFI